VSLLSRDHIHINDAPVHMLVYITHYIAIFGVVYITLLGSIAS